MTGGEFDVQAKRAALVPRVAIAVVALALFALFRGTGPSDDDFIVYRYAQNLIDGHGPVFNPGERVEGFTCPLWMLLIAGALSAGIAPVLASQALGLASVLGAAWAALALRDRRTSSFFPALAIAASPALAFHAAQGLGTPLAAALVAAGYAASARAERGRGSYVVPSILLTLATLLRPETAFFLPAFLWAVPRGRRVACLAPIGLIAGGWFAFRLAYYGEWLPMTWHVKRLPLANDVAYGASYLARATLDCGLGLLLAICAIARWKRVALLDRASTAALAGAWLTTAAVVFVGGDYMPLARFFVPVLPVTLMLAASVLPRVLWIGYVVLAAWPLVRLPELRELHAFQEERWIAIGKELRTRAPRECRLATCPIGAIGFHSGLPIVDMLGITNAVIRRAAPDLHITMKGHHRYDAEWVLAQQPDVIVLGNGVMPLGERRIVASEWERTLVQHPRFQAEYETRLAPVAGSYPLPYFQRRGGIVLPSSESAR